MSRPQRKSTKIQSLGQDQQSYQKWKKSEKKLSREQKSATGGGGGVRTGEKH